MLLLLLLLPLPLIMIMIMIIMIIMMIMMIMITMMLRSVVQNDIRMIERRSGTWFMADKVEPSHC